MAPGPFSSRVLGLCDAALEQLPPGSARAEVEAVQARLRDPLRVAVAGVIKTGKSTLVNSLLRVPVAPTAAVECTRVVAEFRYDYPPRAVLHLRAGGTRELRFDGRTLPPELPVAPAEASYLDVALSSKVLDGMIVVDTPGLGSLDRTSSQSTEDYLATVSGTGVARADALVLVMTQAAHALDAETLKDFQRQAGGENAWALNTVAVLNQADVIRVQGGDPRKLAAELQAKLGAGVADVVPMVARFAEIADAGRLTERDARHLACVARLEPALRDLATRSAAVFEEIELGTAGEQLDRVIRARLLGLLGIDGIRRCVDWILGGASGRAAITERLRQESGISRLRELLDDVFVTRSDPIKAESGLSALKRIRFRVNPLAGEGSALLALRDAVERARLDPGTQQLAALLALRAATGSDVRLPHELADDLRRLALSRGTAAKLGLQPGATADSLRRAAAEGDRRWRSFAYGGRCTPAARRIADVALRQYAALYQLADCRKVPA